MKALMAYDYAKGEWRVFTLNLCDSFGTTAESARKRLNEEGQYLFPCLVDAEIKSLNYANGRYSAELADDFELPEVTTLEQSIKANQVILSNILGLKL